MTWQIMGASVQGTSHVRSGLPCQDAFAYQVSGQGVLLAVADGLGSAPRAEQGAKLAVTEVLAALQGGHHAHHTVAPSWEHQLVAAFQHTRECLQQEADAQNVPLREYGTTLLVAVMERDCFATAHIGDGAIVALLADGSLLTASTPQRGEYANETTPLTADHALDSLCIAVHHPVQVQAVALLTDGLQNLSLNLASGIPYAPFFTPFFEAITHQPFDAPAMSAQLADFLASERVCAKTDDDKTLLIAGRVSVTGE